LSSERLDQIAGRTAIADPDTEHRAPTPELFSAYQTRGRVSGRTHALYRYPARFAPAFVQAAVASLTKPDDVVLDPFVGGGTSAVEALALGRRFVGFDINPISTLLTRVKTTPLYGRDVVELERWFTQAAGARKPADLPADVRLKNTPTEVSLALAPYVTGVLSLPTVRQQEAARAVILDAAQRAIDGREEHLHGSEIGRLMRASLDGLIEGIRELMHAVRSDGRRPSSLVAKRVLRCGDVVAVGKSRGLNRLTGRAGLIVTSPPYPGVHVLYHRWQVGGRSETPLPYWIADAQDGLGPKHYTMGGRSVVGVETYFSRIEAAWAAVRRFLKPDGVVVQLVAFSNVPSQMPLYLAAMEQAGYVRAGDLEPSAWRAVPNRRWYYRVSPEREQAHEILLVHRVAPATNDR
jgi:DNA methylase